MQYEEHIEAALRLLKRASQAGGDSQERLDRFLWGFVRLLAAMPLSDVRFLKEMFTRRLAEARVDGGEFLNLIDGHIAYRELVGNRYS